MTITLEQIKNLCVGSRIYNNTQRYSRSKLPVGVKVTSVTTWKRNPDRVRVGLQYGLYDHWYCYSVSDFENYSLTQSEALNGK
jgi:hypothetical protein